MKKYLNGQLVDMTPEEIAAREAEIAAAEAERAAFIPKSVTPYQARMALLNAGLLDAVEAMIAAPETDRAAKIAWEYATEIQRHSPFVAALAPALGLTDEHVDALFRAAAAIK